MKTYCAWEYCTEQPVGKSKYCATHRKAAREAWKAKIADQQADRQQKYETFEKIWIEAVNAGQAAMEQTTPTPMVVQQHANPLDDNSPVEKSWHVPQGPCGFAWVLVYPGNCSFAHWLKKHDHAGKAYGGGVKVWVNAGGQSVELKSAFAHAMAKVFKNNWDALRMPKTGVIYAQSRLD